MSRWIDADRLLLELSDLIDEFSELDEKGLHSERWCGIMDSKGIIVKAPTISLVRCAECKYWRNIVPTRCTKHFGILVNADDFCSYGKRKESK